MRIFKSDLQAVGDSLSFNTTDSIISLFYNPILWQDTSQLLADTIDIYLRNEALEKVHLKRKALVLTSPDLIYFNQVKGKDIVAYFDSSSLRQTVVSGNAEAIYYLQDDAAAYIGVNQTTCSEMTIDFESGSVRFLRFINQPSGKLEPMLTVSPSSQPKLEGFRWELARRPLRKEDLFTTVAPSPPPPNESPADESPADESPADESLPLGEPPASESPLGEIPPTQGEAVSPKAARSDAAVRIKTSVKPEKLQEAPEN